VNKNQTKPKRDSRVHVFISYKKKKQTIYKTKDNRHMLKKST